MEERKRALLLGLSVRSVWRLKSRFVAADLDPATLAHGNAGRVAAHRLDPPLADRIVAFARDGYAGITTPTSVSCWPSAKRSACRARASVASCAGLGSAQERARRFKEELPKR